MNRSEAHAVFFCKLFNLTMWCEGISWGGRDMDQVVSVPVGIHPEPVCSTVVDFSPLRVGYSEHHYSAASWSLMLPWKNSQLKDWNQCTDKHCIRHCEPGETSVLEAWGGSALLAVFCTVWDNQMESYLLPCTQCRGERNLAQLWTLGPAGWWQVPFPACKMENLEQASESISIFHCLERCG